ncbi:hypothetical protein HCH_02262 [Hahella chejuensis KCTC 2396]|uniref:DUF7668 domain-containing protein n=1 Tax=Hahella chejuensis (strain KCTC 2396) TaxID=349521 RepID=Q2SJT6_HAHCH|nr:hypothetical protein [Hahella chejuensis]ABC29088.1 hypothetical protein HCH_02262 [Hahella chejuensis KCTC 2396]
MDDKIKGLLESLVMLLVNSKFSEIVARNENGRLSQSEIEAALSDYPGVISLPPESTYSSAYIYDIYDDVTEARRIEFDLWYDGEVSDLTLSAEIKKNSSGKLVITIDDIHIL